MEAALELAEDVLVFLLDAEVLHEALQEGRPAVGVAHELAGEAHPDAPAVDRNLFRFKVERHALTNGVAHFVEDNAAPFGREELVGFLHRWRKAGRHAQ